MSFDYTAYEKWLLQANEMLGESETPPPVEGQGELSLGYYDHSDPDDQG